jgi:hypothetical protein
MPAGWYCVFLLLRVAAVAYLVVRTWRTAAAYPQDEVGDEADGDFADAPDRLLVRLT